MEIIVNYIKKGATFRSKKQIAEELSISEKTVSRLVEGMKNHIPTRYSRYAILEDRYNLYAVADYKKYRSLLESPSKNVRESVPKFSPEELAEIFGYEARIMRV